MLVTSEPQRLRPRTPLRLLLAVDSLDPGGAEGHVVELARALSLRGHAVEVACSVGGALEPVLEEAEIPVHVLGDRLVKRRFSPRYAAALRERIAERPVDVVHAHIHASATAAAVATLGSDAALVITEHTEAPWRDREARRMSAWAYGRAAQVVAVSGAIERRLVHEYHVPPARVRFLLPAVGPARPSAGASAVPLPAALAATPLVGRVGRLAPEKGVDVFLRAVARVAPLAPAAHFPVIGDGPLRDELVALAADLGLAERVHFLGFRPDARRLIGLLDVMVVSSRTDGSPLVVLEAMAAGVPVVASAVGGLPDQVRHGREGLLVPPDDPHALADALAGLLGDPARARALGTAGRRRAAGITHDAMVAELEAAYRRALGRLPRWPAPAVRTHRADAVARSA